VSLFDYEDLIEAALESVAASSLKQVELVVVDDGSADGSLERAHAWFASHPEMPGVLLAHGCNRGLPTARNTALERARAELVFILDADNSVYPHGLARLAEALDDDPGASFAYGLIARFTKDGAFDLMSVGPWDPEYLRTVNYIDAMALIRTRELRELGGYSTDLRLYGWEDYDLWCGFAERGRRAVAVPEIVARYRVAPESMLRSVTTISNSEAFAVLIERHPRLMAGLEPPL
jgi:glycosyltransferase involved in cell wall biosynthesis